MKFLFVLLTPPVRFCRRRRRGDQRHHRKARSPSVVVNLVQPGANGMQTIASVKMRRRWQISSIDKEYPPGPALLQGLLGAPPTPDAHSRRAHHRPQAGRLRSDHEPEAAKVSQHMILIEPKPTALMSARRSSARTKPVQPTSTPPEGLASVLSARSAAAARSVTVNAPGGMPITAAARKNRQGGRLQGRLSRSSPARHASTSTYSLPASSRIRWQESRSSDAARLVTPPPSLSPATDLDNLGQEPQTQAHIYERQRHGLSNVKIEGTGIPPRRADAGAAPRKTAASRRSK